MVDLLAPKAPLWPHINQAFLSASMIKEALLINFDSMIFPFTIDYLFKRIYKTCGMLLYY